MEEIKEKPVYTEPKQIRADTSIMLGLKMVEESGLKSGENVKIETETGSGRIVIERMKKEMTANE